MNGIFLLLGTNLGNRLENLQKAKDILEAYEITIVDYSSIVESAPWGEGNQGWFLNMILRIDTIHEPESLLEACMKVEQQMGRQRIKKWGERIIDVDILYYHNLVQESKTLTLPHPGIQMRRFTLMPLVEIAPLEIHPLLNQSHQALLDICPDPLVCHTTSLQISI